MSKAAKGWIIAASILVVLGIALFVGATAVGGFDVASLGNNRYETVSEEVSEDFKDISIKVNAAAIEFLHGEEKQCKVDYTGQEDLKISVEVKDKTLVIQYEDTREWYEHIGIFFKEPKITVYLPKEEYASLSVQSNTGVVTLPKELTFGSITIDSDTSDVDCSASVKENMDIHVSTGDILLIDMKAGGVKVETTTGNVKMIGIDVGGDIAISTTTGDVLLGKAVAQKALTVKCTTGDVGFDRSDADTITVSTTTGDITGTLLSGKEFNTETSVGDIHVPKNTEGGRCELSTTTGDIAIDVQSDTKFH